MLNILLILLRFSPYIFIFCLGFYVKGCQTDRLISDLKNQVIENQEKIIITERKLNDYNNNVIKETFDLYRKNDEIFNTAIKFDFNGLYDRNSTTNKMPDVTSTAGVTAERNGGQCEDNREKYNRCISELESFYKRELSTSKKCDDIIIRYNALIDVIQNFNEVQKDAERTRH